MKKFLIVLVILSFSGIASAQGFKLGVAGNVVFPVSDVLKSASSSTGYGVDAFGVFDIMLLTLTVRAGYLSFGETEYTIAGEKVTESTKAIPVMAGLRWDFGMPVGPSFYAGVEAGIHAFTTTVEVAGVTAPDKTNTEFSIGPNVGLEFAGFDLSAFYMIIKDANYWGLRLGWGIGI